MKKLLSLVLVVAMVLSTVPVVFADGEWIAGLSGSGTEEDPVLISSCADWETFTSSTNATGSNGKGKFYKITNDLDFSTYTWTDSTKYLSEFYGTLDGANHIISNYTVTGDHYGLVWQLMDGSVVKNLGMKDVTFKGINQFYYGAFAGRSKGGKLSNCFVSGVKDGGSNTASFGIMVGQLFWATGSDGGLTIENSYAVTKVGQEGYFADYSKFTGLTADISSTTPKSGITLKNVYTDNGSLVKNGDGRITVTNSYYNKTASNVSDLYGSGLKPNAMRLNVSALGASFKYAPSIDVNYGYPVLAWEEGAADNGDGIVLPVEKGLIDGLSGLGIDDDPVLINSCSDWETFATASIDDGFDGKYFKLTADLDFASYTWRAGKPVNAGYFKGIFDGNNHVISNYTITSKNATNDTYPGLFYALGKSSSSYNGIKNLGMKDVIIDSASLDNWKYAGALVAMTNGGSEIQIENCFVSGIKKTGSNNSMRFGGLIGYLWWTDGATIKNSYVVTKVGETDYVTAADLGMTAFGAIVGQAGVQANGVGTSRVNITNCYSDTNMLLNSSYTSWNSSSGPAATATNSYYNSNCTLSGSSVGTAKKADDLRKAVETLGSAFKYAPSMTNNAGFPKLAWEADAADTDAGLVFVEFNNKINTVDDFELFAGEVAASEDGLAGVTVTLEVDLDLKGATWTTPVGTEEKPFKGTFDGKKHVISNYNFVDTGVSGGIYALFGVIGGDAVIKNLGSKNVTSTSASSITNTAWTGGAHAAIVGIANDNAKISNCFQKGFSYNTFDGSKGARPSYGGSIIACSLGEGVVIENCYALDFVENNDSITGNPGAFGVATALSSMTNCYSNTKLIGMASTLQSKVTNSYYVTGGWNEFNNGTWGGSQVTDDALKTLVGTLGESFGYDSLNNNSGYPMLLWETGAVYENPSLVVVTEINSADDLKAFATAAKASRTGLSGITTKLNTDLNLDGADWTAYMIGSAATPYKGTFDGNCHKISNFVINRNDTVGDSYYGLFGSTAGNAVIKNLGLTDVTLNVNAKWTQAIGSLIGYAVGNTTVTDCFARNVTVTNTDITDDTMRKGSGFIGCVNSDGVSVINCYVQNMTDISSLKGNYKGGLIGAADAINKVENCYSSNTLIRTSVDNSKIVNSYYVTTAGWPWAGTSGDTYRGTKLSADELKAGIYGFNGAYAADKSNVNGGYPVLAWERGFDVVTNVVTSGNTISTITVNKQSGVDGKAILAAYDGNGALVNTKVVTVSAAGGDVTVDFDITGASLVKAYLVDGNNLPTATPNIL